MKKPLLLLLFCSLAFAQEAPKPKVGWKLVLDTAFVTNTMEQPRIIRLSDATFRKRVKYIPSKAGLTQVRLQVESEIAGVNVSIVKLDDDGQPLVDFTACAERKVLKIDGACWLPQSHPALMVQDSRTVGTAMAGALGMFVVARTGHDNRMAEQMAAPNKVRIKLYELDCIENCPAWVNSQ